MLPHEHRAGSPEEWLRYAHSDLEIARVPRSAEMLLENLCFHAQQAVEKALKALLLAGAIEVPRTHSIRRLIDLLPGDLGIPEIVEESAGLTDYAVSARYPGDLEPVDETEYHEAIRVAETVVAWVETILRNLAQQQPGESAVETVDEHEQEDSAAEAPQHDRE